MNRRTRITLHLCSVSIILAFSTIILALAAPNKALELVWLVPGVCAAMGLMLLVALCNEITK